MTWDIQLAELEKRISSELGEVSRLASDLEIAMERIEELEGRLEKVEQRLGDSDR